MFKALHGRWVYREVMCPRVGGSGKDMTFSVVHLFTEVILPLMAGHLLSP